MRMRELTACYAVHGKEAHRLAMESAEALHRQVVPLASRHPLQTRVFQASAVDAEALKCHLGETRVDVVLTDIPYGRQSQWRVSALNHAQSPAGAMLQALRGVLHEWSIVAVASDKSQKIYEEGYERVERFQVGKRRIVLLTRATRYS